MNSSVDNIEFILLFVLISNILFDDFPNIKRVISLPENITFAFFPKLFDKNHYEPHFLYFNFEELQ